MTRHPGGNLRRFADDTRSTPSARGELGRARSAAAGAPHLSSIAYAPPPLDACVFRLLLEANAPFSLPTEFPQRPGDRTNSRKRYVAGRRTASTEATTTRIWRIPRLENLRELVAEDVSAWGYSTSFLEGCETASKVHPCAGCSEPWSACAPALSCETVGYSGTSPTTDHGRHVGVSPGSPGTLHGIPHGIRMSSRRGGPSLMPSWLARLTLECSV